MHGALWSLRNKLADIQLAIERADTDLQLKPTHRPLGSINLATPDFLVMNGTARGGRSIALGVILFVVPVDRQSFYTG